MPQPQRIAAAIFFTAALAAASGCRKHARTASLPPPPVTAPSTADRSPNIPKPTPQRPQQRTPVASREALDAANGETGIASWYGHPYHGRPAANGEIYDMEKLTAAHRTLPFGTWVRVTNLSNNKTVEVRITDRGPFIDGRIIDLSKAGARAIDMIGPGIAQVRLDIIRAPQNVDTVPYLFAIQVGAFQEKSRAESLRSSLTSSFHPVRVVERTANPVFWRVLVGEAHTMEEATALAEQVRAHTREAFVVSLEGVSLTDTGGADASGSPNFQ
jgi:rare lipoprotein A